MTHNRVNSTQATAWLKKTILRRPFVKYYYPIKLMSFVLGHAVIIKNKRLLDIAYRGIASRKDNCRDSQFLQVCPSLSINS